MHLRTSRDRPNSRRRIAPAYLMRLHAIVVEIPRDSWGAGGQTIDTKKISKLIGSNRRSDSTGRGARTRRKMKNTRLS